MGRRAALWLACGVLAFALGARAAEAAVRYKVTGSATLGGPDALAIALEVCEALPNRVFAKVGAASECIAYYPTPGLYGARQAVLYFEGDIPPGYRRNGEKLQSHLDKMQSVLERLAATYKMPYMLVARPGTFGSTGDHRARRGVREYQMLNAAVDRIRARHQLERVLLAGQSGGATAVAALLALGRTDVACATPASGGYDLFGMLDWHAEKGGSDADHRLRPAAFAEHFNVMDHIGDIRPSPSRRIFVLGDPEDRITPFAFQRRFADEVKAAGHHARLVEGKGNGTDRHGLSYLALKMAGLCGAGRSDEEVAGAAR